VGQAPIQAKIYELQKLRCNLCGVVFTAQSPEGVGTEKYDATAGSMIGLLKYGSGMPLTAWRACKGPGIPFRPRPNGTSSTRKPKRSPGVRGMIRQAAQGEVLHNDDTTVKILEFMGARPKSKCLRKMRRRKKRRIVAECSPRRRFTKEGRKIALFSAPQARGENLATCWPSAASRCRADPDV